MFIAIFFTNRISYEHSAVCYARCCDSFFMWPTSIDDLRVFWSPVLLSTVCRINFSLSVSVY